MADLTHVSDDTFDTEVLDSDKPVLVDFWADWCNPCKMIEPHLVALADEHKDKFRVVKVNLDENPRTAGRYGVMSIPTIMLVVDGIERARLVGARPKAAIWAEIESYVSGADLGSQAASSAGA